MKYVPDNYKTQDMCEKAVQICIYNNTCNAICIYICKCVTLWFVAPKMFEDFHNNENLDNDEDFDND